MTPFYLKFADKEQAIAAGLLVADVQDGEIVQQTKRYTLHAIGTIYKTIGEGENATSTPTDGYHVNLLIDELPIELAQYQISVSTPYRVFAGY